MPQRHLSRSFTWIYRMRPRVRHRPEKPGIREDFAVSAAIAPAKAPKRLFLWYMDFDAVERNRALKHNRSSSFTELYLRESHIGEP